MGIVTLHRRDKSRSEAERFFAFVVPEPNSGCWLWIGGLYGSGYGSFKSSKKQGHAHRYSWEFHYGKIPDGLYACHKCDVRCCVNPEHLFLGTAKDNADDMVAKGRDNPRRGETNWKARLTEAEIEKIRLDPRRLKEIGADYGLDRSYVWKIKHGWHWRHSQFENPTEIDRRKNGYAFQAKGEAHPKAKLTEASVRAIRNDVRPSRAIALEYGVAKRTVLEIKHRRIWKHLCD